MGAACKGPFLRPSAIQAGLEMIAVDFVIDSCASALVVWKSWGRLVFCMARYSVAGLEAELRPLHILSRPFVLSHLSPLGTQLVPECLPR